MRRVALLLAGAGAATACTNLIVSAGASETGSPQVAYTFDTGNVMGQLRHFPAADHPSGTMKPIWNQDTGVYLGEIPEAEHTYNVVGYSGGMNEHQLVIGETTFGGLENLTGQEGALIDYNTLMTIVLQRTRTARDAIALMDELVQKYGYASEGESFSIADTKEAWLMELIGKGPGEKGAVWVARRIPDGHVVSHANQARIRTWPRDNTSMWARDVVEFAVKKGLYPADADPMEFSFSDTYNPVSFFTVRLGEARAFSILSVVSDDAKFTEKYLDYAQGRNLTNRMPLSVRAKEALSVNNSMWLMRSRFTGTWFDERSDVGAGAFHAEYRQRPLLWHYDGKAYVNERPIGVQQNAWHYVATPRANIPYPVGGLIWFGVDDQSLSVRTPVYASSTGAPETFLEKKGTADRMTFNFRSADWAFNLVSNFAYSRWSAVFPVVQERIVATEAQFFKDVADMDRRALKSLEQEGSASAIKMLTDFSKRTGDTLTDNWATFFGQLFVRFRDGFDTSLPKPAHEKDIPMADCSEPGYDNAWYKRIVSEAGDKYRADSSSGPDHRLRYI